MRVVYVLLILALLFINTSHSEGNRVYLKQKNVGTDSVNVTVTLDPTQPIRGWEFNVRFNTTSLHVSRVLCSDYFNSNLTFSRPGSLNNSDGTVTNVYGLILGRGNVTEETDLATITFSIISYNESDITFFDSGICNSTEYVTCTFTDGVVHFPRFSLIVNGWSTFFSRVHWSSASHGWGSFGNASLSPDKPPSDRPASPQTKAPINDPLSSLVGAIFAAILITGLLLSLIFSFRRR
jgi:hypothetical protein